jgi:hypothetical protein
MFYRLLSWKNPRATGIAFATTVIFIFAARYLNLIRYIFKSSYMVLGATAAAEVVGQAAFGRGLTSQFRPRQYFTIPKASLERMTDDVEQLINFFVIESQRVVFAENVYVTVAVSSPHQTGRWRHSYCAFDQMADCSPHRLSSRPSSPTSSSSSSLSGA